MLSSISSYFYPSKQQQLSEKFEHAIKAGDVIKVQQYISEHPYLLSSNLTCGLTGFELALRQKKQPILKILAHCLAPYNRPNKHGISPLDHMHLMFNLRLIKNTFPKSLHSLLTGISSSLKDLMSKHSPQALAQINNQHKQLYDEVQTYLKPESTYSSSPLINKVMNNKVEDIQELLSSTSYKARLSSRECFEALTQSILLHHYKITEELILNFGPDLLCSLTTDLKTLYHISAIANNGQAILLLNKHGLKTTSSGQQDLFKVPSPYFYSILHENFDAMQALIEINYVQPVRTLDPQTQEVIYSPLDLLASKAMQTDPYYQSNSIEKGYLITYLLMNLLGYTSQDAYIWTSYFLYKFLYSNFSYGDNLSTISFILNSSITMNLFDLDFLNSFLPKHLLRSVLILFFGKKIFGDFSSYKECSPFRKEQAISNIFHQSIFNFFFIQSQFFSKAFFTESPIKKNISNFCTYYFNKISRYIVNGNWSLNIGFKNLFNFSGTKSLDKAFQAAQDKQLNPAKIIQCTNQNDPSNKIDLLTCLTDYTGLLFPGTKECDQKIKKIYRALSKKIHPDKVIKGSNQQKNIYSQAFEHIQILKKC